MSGVARISEKDWSIHFNVLRTIDLCFVCQLCSFVFFHCETKTKTDFISYVKENGS